jgi:acetyl esterase/lipase
MKILFSILIFAFVFSPGHSQTYSKCWKDIDYAGDNQIGHKLDIYLPQTEKSAYPVVVVIYGSAWFSNRSKGADMNSLGQALLDAGYAVVTPNHRASFEAQFPAQLHDIKAVVRFIRGNADTFRIDTTFIGITGSSSGGSLAAIMGTSRNVRSMTLGNITVDLEGSLGKYTSCSSSVDAVTDWFGPTNMLVMDSCGGTDFIHNDAKSPASLYIGGPIQENREKTLLASPTTYIDPSDPPFLIFHGDADRVVPYCQSQILYEALQKNRVASQFFLIPSGQHGPGVHTAENIQKMVDFFNQSRNR